MDGDSCSGISGDEVGKCEDSRPWVRLFNMPKVCASQIGILYEW
jgi:hypothetical protein